ILFKQELCWALNFALASAGRSIAARMAIMAMTTRSSMRVKARRVFVFMRLKVLLPLQLPPLVLLPLPILYKKKRPAVKRDVCEKGYCVSIIKYCCGAAGSTVTGALKLPEPSKF